MKLLNPTDQELNTAFAEKVCGITGVTNKISWDMCAVPVGQLFGTGQNGICVVPDYCSDANAVLPWLEKAYFFEVIKNTPRLATTAPYLVKIIVRDDGHPDGIRSYFAEGMTLPYAAVIALLRAHGVEIA